MSASWKAWNERHGFGEVLTTESFKRNEVFYVAKLGDDMRRYVSYMMEHHGALGIAIVDEPKGMENVYVTHFVFEDNKADYDQVYAFEDDELVMVSDNK